MGMSNTRRKVDEFINLSTANGINITEPVSARGLRLWCVTVGDSTGKTILLYKNTAGQVLDIEVDGQPPFDSLMVAARMVPIEADFLQDDDLFFTAETLKEAIENYGRT
jgi:hypothetical protein